MGPQLGFNMVIIAKKTRAGIFKKLFNDGVCVVKKDAGIPRHPVMDATNLEVMMVMRSLKSKGLVKETYSWQYRYYTLNDERRGNRERRGNDRDNFRNDDRKKKSTPLGVDGAKPVYNAGRGGPRS